MTIVVGHGVMPRLNPEKNGAFFGARRFIYGSCQQHGDR